MVLFKTTTDVPALSSSIVPLIAIHVKITSLFIDTIYVPTYSQ